MGKIAPKMSKAKRGASTRRHRVLTLKVAGQLQPGRIAIPDLLLICQHVPDDNKPTGRGYGGGTAYQATWPGTREGPKWNAHWNWPGCEQDHQRPNSASSWQSLSDDYQQCWHSVKR